MAMNTSPKAWQPLTLSPGEPTIRLDPSRQLLHRLDRRPAHQPHGEGRPFQAHQAQLQVGGLVAHSEGLADLYQT